MSSGIPGPALYHDCGYLIPIEKKYSSFTETYVRESLTLPNIIDTSWYNAHKNPQYLPFFHAKEQAGAHRPSPDEQLIEESSNSGPGPPEVEGYKH